MVAHESDPKRTISGSVENTVLQIIVLPISFFILVNILYTGMFRYKYTKKEFKIFDVTLFFHKKLMEIFLLAKHHSFKNFITLEPNIVGQIFMYTMKNKFSFTG